MANITDQEAINLKTDLQNWMKKNIKGWFKITYKQGSQPYFTMKFSQDGINEKAHETMYKHIGGSSKIQNKNHLMVPLDEQNVTAIKKLVTPVKKVQVTVAQPQAVVHSQNGATGPAGAGNTEVLVIENETTALEPSELMKQCAQKLVTDLKTDFQITATLKGFGEGMFVLEFETNDDATKAYHTISHITAADFLGNQVTILVDETEPMITNYLNNGSLVNYVPAQAADVNNIVTQFVFNSDGVTIGQHADATVIFLQVANAEHIHEYGKNLFEQGLYVVTHEGGLLVHKEKTSSDLSEEVETAFRAKLNEALRVGHVFDKTTQVGRIAQYSYYRSVCKGGLQLNCTNQQSVAMAKMVLAQNGIDVSISKPKSKSANYFEAIQIRFPKPWQKESEVSVAGKVTDPLAEFFKNPLTSDFLSQLARVWFNQPEFALLALAHIREHNPEWLVEDGVNEKITQLTDELAAANKLLEKEKGNGELLTLLTKQIKGLANSEKKFNIPGSGDYIPLKLVLGLV